jgi:hypothetical protein
MTGNKTLFVTSLYSKLGDTKFGGRVGRIHHYLGSLKTILNMEQDLINRLNTNKIRCINKLISKRSKKFVFK